MNNSTLTTVDVCGYCGTNCDVKPLGDLQICDMCYNMLMGDDTQPLQETHDQHVLDYLDVVWNKAYFAKLESTKYDIPF